MTEQESPELSSAEKLTVELVRVLEPLDTALRGGTHEVADLLDRLGLGEDVLDAEVETIRSLVEDEVGSALETLRNQFFDPIRSGENISIDGLNYHVLLGAINDVYSGIRTLQTLDFTHISGNEVATRMLDFLLVKYLSTYHRSIHDALCLAGIIEEGVPLRVDFSKLPEFLDDPNQVFVNVFGWGEETFTGFLVLYYVRTIFWRFQIPAAFQEPPRSMVEDLVGTAVEYDQLEQELQVPVISVFEEDGSTSVGFRIVPLPGTPQHELPGMAVVPYGLAGASETVEVGEGWTFNVATDADQTGWGIGLWPDTDNSGSHAEVIGTDHPIPNLDATTGLVFTGFESGRAGTTLLGGATGSRLSVQYAELSASVGIKNGQAIFEVNVPTRGRLVVDTNQLDAFLASMLPDDGLEYDFDVTVGWSSDRGLFLERGTGLEVSLPQQQRVGPIELTELYLGVLPNEDADKVRFEGSASADVEIGPVTGSISRFGIAAEVGFPEDGNGNLGPIDLHVGVQPPNGIAISIDVGVVTGGGFLDYDPEHERYTGVVVLKIGEITLNAVGLLSTDVPGDEAAYSLLVIVAGEFPRIRLGLGFSLTGAGGIVGLHRSVKAESLGQVVRDGALDSVLFPQDPVVNADRILSDLRRIFPVTPDSHVFGPIVQLEWGEPTILTANLGVVLELPSWKIAVLGDFQVVLPNEDNDRVTLNMAASGIIDPDEERVDVDASLYDSRLVEWTLTGDMALRTKRGDDPQFVLSIGGFNPRYDPPSDVPSLERVTATLGPSSGNPTLEFAGYLAITSNTVQAGASVDAVAKAGPALAEGRISFDALIEFDPFGFVADFHSSFSVTVKGKGFSVDIDGTISGPGPFRVQGKIKISLFLFSISASLDVKLGSGVTVELPRARVMPELEAELARAANWMAKLPNVGDGFADLREIDEDGERVIAHPLAEIGVRQTVVPLGFEIEKFGEATPSEYTHFELADATVEGAALELAAETEEHFAPAQYAKLSDAERLESPAFETHPAGRKLRDRGVYLGYDDGDGREANLRQTTLEYSCVVFDEASERNGAPLASLGGFTTSLSGFGTGVVAALEDVGAVANSPARRTGLRRFRLSEADKLADRAITDGRTVPLHTDDGLQQGHRGRANPDVGGLGGKISMSSDRYVIVEGGSLTPVSIPTAPNARMSKATAKRALSRYRSQNPTHARSLRVVPTRETPMEEIQ
ncbi:DUF6603 domain-containing protein [Natronorarus salvus]|uniref:DUF6603 domain-containing protein n=1 Tax=Natronorarus salvus TaxID=3117733 RepID=UPI002F262AE0